MNGSENDPESGREITSVHVDERERSVVICARYAGLPEDAPAEWRSKGLNAYEQYTVYTSVDELDVDGWDCPLVTDWTWTALSKARIAVTLTGTGTAIRFHADAAVRRERRGLLSGAF